MKRILFAALLTATLTTGLTAQRARGPGGAPLEAASRLKEALGLTDAQVEAIKGIVQAAQPRFESIRTEIQQRRQTLDTLLNAAAPSPMEVGNAAIALHATEAKVQAERNAVISQIKQQLTGEQQQKLDTLLAAGRGLPIPGLGGPGGPGGPGGRGGRGQGR